MKKNFFKFLAKTLFVLVYVFVLLSSDVSAAEAQIISTGNCGAEGFSVNWTLYDNGVLIISGEGNMANYSIASESPFKNNEHIKHIIIEDGITSIGDSVFIGCSVETLTIANTVTKIGNLAFNLCSNLQTVIIPDSVETIGSSSFSDCVGLTDVEIGDGLTKLDGFTGCTNLKKIVIGKNVSTVSETALLHCENLSTFTLDESNEHFKLTDGVLYSADGTLLIRYPANETQPSYSVLDGTTKIVSGAFCGSEHLKNVTLPETLINIVNYSFEKSGISELVTPDSVTSFGDYVFKDCENLKHVYLGSGVESLHYSRSFSECASLEKITVSADNQNYSDISGVLFNKDQTEIIKYPSGINSNHYNIPEGVTNISSEAFETTTQLSSITLPTTVTDLTMNPFFKCNSLENIYVDEANTSYVSEQGVLYTHNYSTLVSYPLAKTEISLLTESLRTIGHSAFRNNPNLIDFIIPQNVYTILMYSFSGCENLETIDLANVSSISSFAFSGCKKLNNVVIPSSVTELQMMTFSGCNALKNLTLPSSLTSINISAFGLFPQRLGYSITNVFYAGSKDDWDKISITYLNLANVHYNSTSHTYYETYFAPTCVKEGYINYHCNYCDDNYNVITDSVTNHVYSQWISNNNSTHSKHCINNNNCTDTQTQNCSYDEWIVVEEATETEEGTKTRTCKICNYKESASIPTLEAESNPYETIFYNYDNDILTIYGSGSIPEREGNLHPWYQYHETATAIIVDGNISNISPNSFYEFSNISTLISKVPEITIESNAFSQCDLLENIIVFGNSTINGNIVSNTTREVNIFKNELAVHTTNSSSENLNIITFKYDNSVLNWNGNITVGAYNFFDIIAAFCDQYSNVATIHAADIAFTDIALQYFNETTFERRPVEGNKLNNASFSVIVDTYPEPTKLTFNELCDGIRNGEIQNFTLIVDDPTADDVVTDVVVKEEESFILRALKWIVSLLNKLFKLLSRLK